MSIVRPRRSDDVYGKSPLVLWDWIITFLGGGLQNEACQQLVAELVRASHAKVRGGDDHNHLLFGKDGHSSVTIATAAPAARSRRSSPRRSPPLLESPTPPPPGRRPPSEPAARPAWSGPLAGSRPIPGG